MRKILVAALVAGLLWLFAGPVAGLAVNAGDNLPDGNGALPVMMIGGDIPPDGNG